MGSLVGLLGWWLEPFPAGPRLERLWQSSGGRGGGGPGCCSQVGLGGDSWGSWQVGQGGARRDEKA